MNYSKFCLAGLAVVVLTNCQLANAALTIIGDSTGGGALAGVNYANFDGLPLGGAGGVSSGVTVSFNPDAQAVSGSLSGFYAAPYVSGNNNQYFETAPNTPNPGPDSTTYLTAAAMGVPPVLRSR